MITKRNDSWQGEDGITKVELASLLLVGAILWVCIIGLTYHIFFGS